MNSEEFLEGLVDALKTSNDPRMQDYLAYSEKLVETLGLYDVNPKHRAGFIAMNASSLATVSKMLEVGYCEDYDFCISEFTPDPLPLDKYDISFKMGLNRTGNTIVIVATALDPVTKNPVEGFTIDEFTTKLHFHPASEVSA